MIPFISLPVIIQLIFVFGVDSTASCHCYKYTDVILSKKVICLTSNWTWITHVLLTSATLIIRAERLRCAKKDNTYWSAMFCRYM